MTEQVTFNRFCDSFSGSYENNLTYEGKRAWFDYLEELEESMDEAIELDPIALCCEYSEYENLAELQANYNNIHKDKQEKIITILEKSKQYNIRVTFSFGDVNNGLDWNEKFDIIGRIGRSTGTVKIPLPVYNARSLGVGALLDNCIVKIE